MWRFTVAENRCRDLIFAVRTLRRSRGLCAGRAPVSGAWHWVNAAIFSIAVEFLLSEPSVREAKSVVYVQQGRNSHMQPALLDPLRRSGIFEDVAGENEESFINFNNGTETVRIFALQATKNYFSSLGVPVAQSRGWNEADPDDVVVLHPQFWQSWLNGDPAILGKAIRLDGRLRSVRCVARCASIPSRACVMSERFMASAPSSTCGRSVGPGIARENVN